MPSTNDFSPNNVWGSAAIEGTSEEVTTPTGQTCLAAKMSIEGMVTAGILAEADAITAMVSKYTRKVRGAKGKPDGQELDESALLRDPKALVQIVGLMDKAMPHIVKSPKVALHYEILTVGKTVVQRRIEPEDRQEGIVYTDQIDFQDKMFLFDWAAGGLGSMLNFRV